MLAMIKYLSALLMREINEAKTENMVEFLDMSLPEEKKKKNQFSYTELPISEHFFNGSFFP
jgi:hypothetical protein